MLALYTTTTTDQDVLANGLLDFNTNVVQNYCTCALSHVAGSTTIDIKRFGVYLVSVNVDVTPTAAGDIAIQLLDNGVAVQGATSGITGVAATRATLSFTSLVKVMKSCPGLIDNQSNLQVALTNAGTVNNASMTVVQVA